MNLDNEYYYAFVLGNDLLNDEFREFSSSDCDLIYNFCCKIARDFLKSDYYKDKSCSSYEMFCDYVEDNIFEILKEYEKITGSEEKYFKGAKKLLEISTSGNESIALVKWRRKNGTQYVIAKSPNINGEELTWGSGYYYSNLDDAIYDFELAKKGKCLTSDSRTEKRINPLKGINTLSYSFALEHLFLNGRKNLLNNKYYQYLQDNIMANDDTRSIVKNEFVLDSLKIAKTMAEIGTLELCRYIYNTEKQSRKTREGKVINGS